MLWSRIKHKHFTWSLICSHSAFSEHLKEHVQYMYLPQFSSLDKNPFCSSMQSYTKLHGPGLRVILEVADWNCNLVRFFQDTQDQLVTQFGMFYEIEVLDCKLGHFDTCSVLYYLELKGNCHTMNSNWAI